ncbi:hypothetical protein HY374_00345 [Candidatus Berkelbacteria bacterium]|nr:hypothetical protein [Candidatus Berkelbacteria bacterium]
MMQRMGYSTTKWILLLLGLILLVGAGYVMLRASRQTPTNVLQTQPEGQGQTSTAVAQPTPPPDSLPAYEDVPLSQVGTPRIVALRDHNYYNRTPAIVLIDEAGNMATVDTTFPAEADVPVTVRDGTIWYLKEGVLYTAAAPDYTPRSLAIDLSAVIAGSDWPQLTVTPDKSAVLLFTAPSESTGTLTVYRVTLSDGTVARLVDRAAVELASFVSDIRWLNRQTLVFDTSYGDAGCSSLNRYRLRLESKTVNPEKVAESSSCYEPSGSTFTVTLDIGEGQELLLQDDFSFTFTGPEAFGYKIQLEDYTDIKDGGSLTFENSDTPSSRPVSFDQFIVVDEAQLGQEWEGGAGGVAAPLATAVNDVRYNDGTIYLRAKLGAHERYYSANGADGTYRLNDDGGWTTVDEAVFSAADRNQDPTRFYLDADGRREVARGYLDEQDGLVVTDRDTGAESLLLPGIFAVQSVIR